jgi:MFS family permease
MYDIRHLNRRALVFRNRAFGLLWFGQLLSGAGDWLLLVAVPVYVFQLTRSASDAGFALVADVTPRLLLGPVAGVYADRWPRRRVMIGADLLSAAAVGVMLLGCARSDLWLLLAGVAAESACCTFFSPACTGLVPAVVGRDGDLAVANGWFAVSGGFQRLAAAPLGGALYALGGFWLPATIDAASYLASALLVALITSTPSARPHGERAIGPFGAELRHGLVALVRNRTLRVLLTASSLFLFGNAALTALFVPYVVASLHLRAGRIGELFSALGAGFLVSAVTGRAAGQSSRLRACACTSLGLVTAAFAGFLAWRSFWAAAGSLALAGLAAGSFLQLQQTAIQRTAPEHLIGRISAAYATITLAMTLTGALLAASTVSWIGRTETMALAVTAIGGAAATALLLPARRPSAEAVVSRQSGHRSIRGSGQRVRCGGRIPRSCGSEPTGARRAPDHPSTRLDDPVSGLLPRRR